MWGQLKLENGFILWDGTDGRLDERGLNLMPTQLRWWHKYFYASQNLNIGTSYQTLTPTTKSRIAMSSCDDIKVIDSTVTKSNFNIILMFLLKVFFLIIRFFTSYNFFITFEGYSLLTAIYQSWSPFIVLGYSRNCDKWQKSIYIKSRKKSLDASQLLTKEYGYSYYIYKL